jgi:DNA-binding transcriptional MerR regulator
MNETPRAMPPVKPAGTEAPASPGLTLSIGDLARELGITTRAIRFYEARGLISPGRRGANRTFGPEDHRRLTLILRAKNLGLSLEEIGEHLALHDGVTAATAKAELAALRQRADRHIAMLKAKRGDLVETLGDLARIRTELSGRMAQAKRSGS